MVIHGCCSLSPVPFDARIPSISRRYDARLPHMSLAYAEEAIHVHDTGHLSDRDIARATGAAPSTVREWLARRSAPSGVRAERLAELSSLVERLARVIRPTYIPVWLSKPIPALDDDKPIDRIAKGDYRAVARLISGLEDPGAS
jgi:hypothetical protein